MKGGKLPLGYTIVEVLIVLAVSGVMFVIAANFISGKHQKVSFQQGSNELASRLQSIIESVTDGEYTDIPLNCTASGVQVSFSSSGSPNQGHNPSCVFLGKIVHFTKAPASTIKYEVFSLAGARTNPDGTLVTDPSTSKLAPIASTPNLTVQDSIPQNLSVSDVRVTDGAGSVINDTYYAFGFVQGLGSDKQVVPGEVLYNSGYQNVSMVYVRNTGSLGNTSSVPVVAPMSQITQATTKTALSAVVCVTDGTRYARINIGPDGSNTQSALEVTIKQLGQNPTC